MCFAHSFLKLLKNSIYFFAAADFLATVFLVAVFLEVAFLATGFLATAFLALAFLVNALGIFSSIIFFTSSKRVKDHSAQRQDSSYGSGQNLATGHPQSGIVLGENVFSEHT